MAEPFNLSRFKRAHRTAPKPQPATTPASKKHHRYKGTEHIPLTVFHAWRNRAKRDKIGFDLTIDDVEKIWSEQNGSCILTGRAMTVAKNDPAKVSLDRVDPAGPYERSNVRLVCTAANYVRHTLTDDELHRIMADIDEIRRLRESLSKNPRGGGWYRHLQREQWQRVFGRTTP